MGDVRITRSFGIDFGHRLRGHEGKCRNYHGHRGVFEVTCVAPKLDAVGRVIDFSVIKERVGGWLDAAWDHGMILQIGDPMIALCRAENSKVYVIDEPPTSEHLVAHFDVHAQRLLAGTGVRVVHTCMYETPNCRAEVDL